MERAFGDLDAPVKRLNGVFAPAPYSAALFAPMVPDAAAISRAVRDLLAE